jgi:beta-N-acetylglucosaminidase
MFRFDTARNNLVYGKQFKDIYRQFNIRMTVEDQKLIYEYLRLNAPVEEAVKEVKKSAAHGDANLENKLNTDSFKK